MAALQFKEGQRVYHEPDNNAAIWRGTVMAVQDNGCVWVQWDGDCGQKLIDAHELQASQ